MPTAKRAWVSGAQAKVTPLPPNTHSWPWMPSKGAPSAQQVPHPLWFPPFPFKFVPDWVLHFILLLILA